MALVEFKECRNLKVLRKIILMIIFNNSLVGVKLIELFR